MKIKKYVEFDKDYIKQIFNLNTIHEQDFGNDFEKIVRKENKEILYLLDFLSSLETGIFSRMTGSGSCCYVVFENKNNAKKAFEVISKKYSDYWVYLAENNIIKY